MQVQQQQQQQPVVSEDVRARITERVSYARSGLLDNMPFFGSLALKLKVVVTYEVPRAAVTRDRQLLLNPHFVDTLDDHSLAFVIVHEVCHPAFECFLRGEDRREMGYYPDGTPVSIWNMAHDYAINDIIKLGAVSISESHRWRPSVDTLPNGCLWNKKYRGWSAEKIYDDLLETLPPGKHGRRMVPSPDGQPTPFGPDDMRPDLGESGGDGDDEAVKANLDQAWKEALLEAALQQEMAKQRGDLPGIVQSWIKEITDPKLPWQVVMSAFLGENGGIPDYSYRRISRRSEAVGELLPGVVKQGYEDICVLWDTSGSMGGQEQQICSEVIGMCSDLNLTLRVIMCDTRVAADYRDVDETTDLCFKGGGGSNFLPAFQLLEDDEFEGVVVSFTDGYITVPSSMPHALTACLWVIGPRGAKCSRWTITATRSSEPVYEPLPRLCGVGAFCFLQAPFFNNQPTNQPL